jgi:HSP20 family molecular chaperone IbpA
MLFDAFYYNNNHPMNVKEDSEGWTIEMRATGLTKEDITLTFEPENILVIKSAGEKEKETDYVRHEFWKDRFNDTKIMLPAGAHQEGITARVVSGILEIRVQKDKTSSKQITVE